MLFRVPERRARWSKRGVDERGEVANRAFEASDFEAVLDCTVCFDCIDAAEIGAFAPHTNAGTDAYHFHRANIVAERNERVRAGFRHREDADSTVGERKLRLIVSVDVSVVANVLNDRSRDAESFEVFTRDEFVCPVLIAGLTRARGERWHFADAGVSGDDVVDECGFSTATQTDENNDASCHGVPPRVFHPVIPCESRGFSMKTIFSLCVIAEPDRILLGMKKRGFGAGRWNGFGGKVGEGETIEEAAKREVTEECGLTVDAMQPAGVLEFTFDGKEEDVLAVHVFLVTAWHGEPSESEEMRPEWFAIDAIPYTDMWPDDIFWLPSCLEGKMCNGAFHFAADGSVARQSLIIGE